MSVAIKIESVSKLYRLGTVGTGTLSHDLNRWWHQIRGKEDPYAKIGQVNDRTKRAASDEKREASEDPATSSPLASRHSQLSSPSPLASSSSQLSSPLASRNSSLRASGPDYVWALKDINLEVAQGEILGIIGRNGAGKSTLLKLLSRVTAPTTGAIKTKGRIASLLEVGTGFHPELTGRENIYMNGAILGMRRHDITRQLDAIVEFSGCAKYLDTPVKRYSSGMLVRLGFAVAAHLSCEILIVDEVLAVGDAAFQAKCTDTMSNVAASGRTILFVSHNLAAVSTICSSCLYIDKGCIDFNGSTKEATHRYINGNKPPIADFTPRQPLGESFVKLHRAFVTQNKEQTAIVDINEPTQIEMHIETKNSCRNLICSAIFHSVEGLTLFATADWKPNQLSPGHYKCTLQIPGMTYSEGQISVDLGIQFFDPHVQLVFVKDALSFLTIDSNHPASVRGLYKNDDWPGVVRLKLDWNLSKAN